ncbi:glycosyl transferasegroup 2 family protein, partial [Aphelenchoides avenae]
LPRGCRFARSSSARTLPGSSRRSILSSSKHSYNLHTHHHHQRFRIPEDQIGNRLEIKQQDMCLDALSRVKVRQSVGLYKCHNTGGNQEWIYNKKLGTIRHANANMCLSLDENTGEVVNQLCQNARGWHLSKTDGSLRYGDLCVALIPKTDISVQKAPFTLQGMPCDPSDSRQAWSLKGLVDA